VVVLFKVEADATIGIGHLMRCCALAVALNNLTRVVCYFELPVFELARAILAPAGVRPEVATPGAGGDIVIADVGELSAASILSLRLLARLVVSIEDLPGPTMAADVLVRPNILEERPPKGEGAYFGGREFILLQPIYADRNPLPIRNTVRRVMICFGGSDPANLSRRFVSLLELLDCRAEFRLAIGPHYRWKADLLKVCGSIPQVAVIEGVTSLAKEIADCDLAITSGGTLAYEACALGRPVAVISQNDDQAKEASVLANAGAILNIGRHNCVSNDDIVRAMRRLWDDRTQRQQQSLAAYAFIPRDGARRVAVAILDQLQKASLKGSAGIGAGEK
jgi:spore coat polysaccharide biosynthesis predicted glycosyltransferase SpsG